MEASLKRLRRDNVELFQLHNPLAMQVEGEKLTPDEVLGEVVPALQRLRDQGKTRFLGLTAIGDTAALHRVVNSRAFDVAQVPYNALNPSPGEALPKDYPAQDYGRLLERTQAAGMGTIGIRVLAGGALSGREERHPLGMQAVEPIGSGSSYKADVRARAAVGADGARGPCGEPDRARHALRHRPSGPVDDGDRARHHRSAGGGGAGHQQGPAVAAGARAPQAAAGQLRWRAALISAPKMRRPPRRNSGSGGRKSS